MVVVVVVVILILILIILIIVIRIWSVTISRFVLVLLKARTRGDRVPLHVN
jgi:hypothetical protein